MSDDIPDDVRDEIREAFEVVIKFLLEQGYTGEQLAAMGPEESLEIARLEYALMKTE